MIEWLLLVVKFLEQRRFKMKIASCCSSFVYYVSSSKTIKTKSHILFTGSHQQLHDEHHTVPTGKVAECICLVIHSIPLQLHLIFLLALLSI